MPTVLADFVPVGAHTATTLSGSATTLTVDASADGVLMQAIAQNIYYTLDGSTPTSGNGFTLYAGGDPLRVPKNSDIAIKVLRAASGAVLQWQAVRSG